MNEDLINELPYLKKKLGISTNSVGINLPNGSLFHYTPSVMAVKNIISNGELWLSKSSFMNDKSELSYGLSIVDEVFSDYDTSCVPKVHKVLKESIHDNYFILCFSCNPNSRFLWENYSNKNGYVLEFKPDFISDFVNSEKRKQIVFENGKTTYRSGKRKIDIKSNKNLPTLTPNYGYEYMADYVSYDISEQKEIIKEIVEYMIKNNQNIGRFTQAGWLLYSQILFFKDPFFKDEDEYRLIIKVESSDKRSPFSDNSYLKRVVNYREKSNCLIPYLTLLTDNISEYINSIGIGYGNRETYAKVSLEEFVSIYANNINVYQVNAPLQMF